MAFFGLPSFWSGVLRARIYWTKSRKQVAQTVNFGELSKIPTDTVYRKPTDRATRSA